MKGIKTTKYIGELYQELRNKGMKPKQIAEMCGVGIQNVYTQLSLFNNPKCKEVAKEAKLRYESKLTPEQREARRKDYYNRYNQSDLVDSKLRTKDTNEVFIALLKKKVLSILTSSAYQELTQTENKVCYMALRGLSTRVIGYILGCSHQNISVYINRLRKSGYDIKTPGKEISHCKKDVEAMLKEIIPLVTKKEEVKVWEYKPGKELTVEAAEKFINAMKGHPDDFKSQVIPKPVDPELREVKERVATLEDRVQVLSDHLCRIQEVLR